jgi:hypothetical protein
MDRTVALSSNALYSFPELALRSLLDVVSSIVWTSFSPVLAPFERNRRG